MSSKNMIQDPETLIIKHLNKECSAAEEEMLFEWIGASEENERIFRQTCEAWELTGLLGQKDIFDTDHAWSKVKNRLGFGKIFAPVQVFRQAYRVAASIVLLAALGGIAYWFIKGDKGPQPAMLVVASVNDIKSITLPDGSKVWLNRESKLTYPEHFSAGTRELGLEGEAFFEVAPDSSCPFLVNTSQALIRVVGTSFNVKAYPAGSATQVVVATGKVQLSPANRPEGAVLLLPGQMGHTQTNDIKASKEINQDINYLAWKDHRLVFRETPLSQVSETLWLAFRTKMIITDDSIGNMKLTAKYDNNLKPEEIMEIIAINFGLVLQTSQNGDYRLLFPQ